MNQKGLSLILIVIILTALVGGYLIYQNQTKPTPSPQPFDSAQGKPTTQPSSLPTSSPSSTTSAETANWKTYRNQEYKLEFKYPPRFILKDNENKEYIKYFHLNIYNDPAITKNDPDKYFRIGVYVHNLPLNTDLLAWLKSEQYQTINGEKIKIFDEIKPYTTETLNGYYYFGGVEYMSWNVYLEKDGKVYSFSFSESEAGRYPEPEKKEPNILDQILSTFKFLP